MATFKYYDGTKYNRITGGLVPKTANTTSDTETYSCNYVNTQVDDLNTTIAGVDSIASNKPDAISTYAENPMDTYNCVYINNTISNSRLKSAILVALSENKSLTVSTAWSDITIPFNKVLRKIGDGFSLNTSTGTITASENVKNVKVTIGVRIDNNISGSVYPRIYSQSGISNFTESGGKSSGQIKNETIDKCDTSKNIQGGFRCSATGEVILTGSEQYTYMLVEEL